MSVVTFQVQGFGCGASFSLRGTCRFNFAGFAGSVTVQCYERVM